MNTQNNPTTGQGIDEQHPGQEAEQRETDTSPTIITPVDVDSILKKLSLVNSTVETNPEILDTVRAIITAHPQQVTEIASALNNLIRPTTPIQTYLDDGQIAVIVGLILLALLL